MGPGVGTISLKYAGKTADGSQFEAWKARRAANKLSRFLVKSVDISSLRMLDLHRCKWGAPGRQEGSVPKGLGGPLVHFVDQ